MARADQIPRQWRILRRLETHRYGLSANDLASEEGCPVRTIYRDLADLEEAGFPLIQERVGKRSLWRLAFQRNKPHIPFHYTEVCALWLGRRFMKGLEGTNFYDEINSALEKIRSTLPPGVLEHLEEFSSKVEVGRGFSANLADSSGFMPTINKALEECARIEITYFTPNKKNETTRKIDPYRMLFQGEAIYLIGYCHLREGVRTFNVARIRDVKETEEFFDEPDFDLEEYMGDGFRIMTGEVMEIEIHFDASVAHVAQEKIWHSTQELIKQEDGSVLLKFKAGGLIEIKTWVLSFGPKVQVVKPEALKEAVLNDYKQALELYKESGDL